MREQFLNDRKRYEQYVTELERRNQHCNGNHNECRCDCNNSALPDLVEAAEMLLAAVQGSAVLGETQCTICYETGIPIYHNKKHACAKVSAAISRARGNQT